MNPFSLKDKVIVVTGGTGILGQAFIEAIAAAGGTIGILGRNMDVARHRAAQINSQGGKAMALKADVLKEDELKASRDEIWDAYGRIDGLVNAAGGNTPGGVLQPGANIFKMNMSGMREVADLNLWGTVNPTQIFGEAIAQTGGGSIVNISSMAAEHAITRVLAYSMAKAAIDNYTKWFATELAIRYGDTIRMNAIAPGFFITEQNRTLLTQPDGSYTERGNLVIKKTPFSRFGNPDELKGALVWLLSEESRFVSGTIIKVDGGFSAFSGV